MNKLFKYFLGAVAFILVLIAGMPLPIHAQDVDGQVTCRMQVSDYREATPNHFEITIHITGAQWGHLDWWGSEGTDAQDGDVKPVDFSYDKPDRWLQDITLSVDGVICDTKSVTIFAWQPGDTNPPEDGTGQVPGSAEVIIPKVPVVLGSKAWNCVDIKVVPRKVNSNTLDIQIHVQGELPVNPVKLYFGDGSYTYPTRTGDMILEYHDYDVEVLKKGINVSVDLTPLGDFGTCLYTTFTFGGIESYANNTGVSYVK